MIWPPLGNVPSSRFGAGAMKVAKASRYMNREERTVTVQLRATQGTDGKRPRITGYAALFDVPADLGPFIEVVKRGAFAKAIQDDDVRALFNHNPNFVLGRNRAGTLRMSEDDKGLAVEIDPPDAQWARDLIISMRRGDVDQMSFAFIAKQTDKSTQNGKTLRTLLSVRLLDTSVVTYPAYTQTSAAVRGVRSVEQIYREELLSTDHASVVRCRHRLHVEGVHDVYRRKLDLLRL